ncbi:uncharacterized protein LOC134657691 [Cydia amplana]|uniref:uncharacterized protein LOC134657691 n=1 Tax=Cydia amplana TaxID=1869771 RepID=UPI002FE58F4A
MQQVAGLPCEVTSLIKYWYHTQKNSVRWAGVCSEEYRLECGVRQGGISSPRLFNLYINGLIEELSNASVGCSVDGVFMNNFSYADDMVLLAPSLGALQTLIGVCERYAGTHGLKYNAKKSEFLLFKAGAKTYEVLPPITLCGTNLNRVRHFKYLGHWVTDDLCDNMDIERERRALSVRCNMLARRFAGCTKEVKITLFRAYCQCFYTCNLWVNFTQRTYSALRVQYNDAFRMLLGFRRRCSASGMFAEASVDGFHAIIRKRCASLLDRLLGSPSSILRVFAGRWDSPMMRRWIGLHSSFVNYDS